MTSTQRPLVSVIIPAYNSAETIALAVRSALDQTWAELEVVVVDDASADATRAVVQSISDPRMRLLGNERNLGEGLSRNAGVAAARGEWIAMLDADDAWRPQRLERLFDLARAHAGPLVLADNLMHCYAAGGALRPWKPQWDARELPFRDGAAVLDLAGWLRLPRLLLKPVIPAHILRERKLLHSARVYAADTEFLIRALSGGPRLLIAEEPLYLYRKRPGSASDNPRRADLMREMFEALLRELEFTAPEKDAVAHRLAALDRERRYLPFLAALKSADLADAARRAARDPVLVLDFCRRLPASIAYRLTVLMRGGSTR